MKSRIDAILQRSQAEYLDSLLPPRGPLLQKMERYAEENGHPIADPEVAQLMRLLVRVSSPKRVLEIGTNIGYSVIVMGRECGPDTRIETIEIDPGTLDCARSFVREAELEAQVVFHQGAALEVIPRLSGPFDLVFIDCVKTEYGDYLDLVLPLLGPGSLIVCDNLLWKGQIADGPRSERDVASTAALAAFNQRITSDPRLLTTILPVGDGVGISVFG